MYALDSSSLSSIPKLIITSIDASSNTSLQSTMKSNEDISNTTYCLYLLALSAVIFILIYPSFILWASRRSAASFIITFTILFAVSFIVSRHLILTSSIAAFAVSFTEAFAGYNIGIVEFYIGGAVGRHHSAESPSITPATNEYYLYIGGAVGTSKEFAFKIIETSDVIINIGIYYIIYLKKIKNINAIFLQGEKNDYGSIFRAGGIESGDRKSYYLLFLILVIMYSDNSLYLINDINTYTLHLIMGLFVVLLAYLNCYVVAARY